MEDITMNENKNTYKKSVAAKGFLKEENYWLDKLSGEISRSFFPYDYNKLSPNPPQNRAFEFKFTGELHTKLEKLRNGSMPRLHMILITGLVTLLHKVTGNVDIIIGSPIQKQASGEKFINTALTLRNTVGEKMTFKELLLHVRQTIVEATQNQNYPLETLPSRLNIQDPQKDRFSLFNVALLVGGIHDKSYIEHIPLDMFVSFSVSDGGINGAVEYNPSLYRESTIERIVSYYEQIFHTALSNIDIMVTDISILSRRDKRKIIFDFNNTKQPYPADKTIHGLFEEQAGKVPDNIAVTDPEHPRPATREKVRGPLQPRIRYHELDRKSGQLARLLREKGVKPGAIVGIMVGRSIDMIVGMLGILKAGAAYLPIDPAYPEERIKYMVADSGTRILLTTHKEMMPGLKDVAGEIVFLDSAETFSNSNPALEPAQHPSTLAYVIYTSGSTGRPKGVLIRHHGFVNLVHFHGRLFGEGPGDRVSQVASPGFDAMAFEVWPCLLNGAGLYIVSDHVRVDVFQMKQWLLENKINLSFQSTLMGEQLLKEKWPERDVPLRVLIVAGDRLTRYPRHSLPFKFYNLYGPTEDTVWTTWAEVPADPGDHSLPVIGKPITNHQVYITDRYLRLQPIGVPGELCIGGEGLSLGYLNRPELTAEKFILARGLWPAADTTGYLYKTGDLARWLPDGNIEFLGRIDQQVKLRGYRIELAEIETLLSAHDDIKDAVVIVRRDEQGQKYLCAYFTAAGETGNTNKSSELKEYLAHTLPDYMIPSYFVPMEKIPLTAHDKVDRNALPEPEITAAQDYAAPANETERIMAEIWADVLNINKEAISTNQNFFELGGHSLKATILASEIHNHFEVRVPLIEIFEKQTISAISRYIKETGENQKQIDDENLALLKQGHSQNGHIFFIHEATGAVDAYIDLCLHLESDFNCWGIKADKLTNLMPHNITINSIANNYIQKMKKIQPEGPYHIAGWSLGGTIAFEIVRQLEELRDTVGFFAMIDTYTPQNDLSANVKEFSGYTEWEFLQQLLANEVAHEETIEKLNKEGEFEDIWPQMADYFETGECSGKILDDLMAKYNIEALLPNKNQLSVRDKIHFLNLLRSINNAWLSYMPVRKINSPIHYFKAMGTIRNQLQVPWYEYSTSQVITYELPGDHYSILTPPAVIGLAGALDKAIKNQLESNSEVCMVHDSNNQVKLHAHRGENP
jgi:amino acid adenylation domain-containing protein